MKLIDQIKTKLEAEFAPSSLEIADNSHNHLSGNSETRAHFIIRIESAKFQNLKTIQQHKLVYQCLSQELKNNIHALSLETIAS